LRFSVRRESSLNKGEQSNALAESSSIVSKAQTITPANPKIPAPELSIINPMKQAATGTTSEIFHQRHDNTARPPFLPRPIKRHSSLPAKNEPPESCAKKSVEVLR